MRKNDNDGHTRDNVAQKELTVFDWNSFVNRAPSSADICIKRPYRNCLITLIIQETYYRIDFK